VWPFWRPKPLTSVTVRPVTPTSASASRTSSSLNGLTMAVICFMPAPGAAKVVSLRAEPRGDRVAPVPAEGTMRDADAHRRLASLVFVVLDEARDALDGGTVEV